MLREVSDLSTRSYSDGEDFDAPLEQLPASQLPASISSLWKSYDNPLTANTDDPDVPAPVDQKDGVADSEDSTDVSPNRGRVRFNTTFEPDTLPSKQEDSAALPATWSACDNDDLGAIATLLAAAGSMTVQQVPNPAAAASSQGIFISDQIVLEAEDMLGLGILDLRSCTLVQSAPGLEWAQVRLNASFSSSPQVRNHVSRNP